MPSKILFAFALFAVVGGLGYYFFPNPVSTRASQVALQRHEVVNLSPQQAGIFWSTGQVDKGSIMYGTDEKQLSMVARDELDIQKGNASRLYHYVLLSNLQPDTVYYYRIIVNETGTVGKDTAFSLRTSHPVGSSGATTPVYGKIVSSSGGNIQGAYVLVTIEGSYPLLSVTGGSGEWLVPLQYVVDKNSGSYIAVKDNQVLDVNVVFEKSSSKIKVKIADAHPVRRVTEIGKNYLLLNDPKVLSAKTTMRTQKTVTSHNFEVRYPKQGAVIPGSSPLVKGYAPALSEIIGLLTGPVSVQARTRANDQGEWNLSFGKVFPPGKYSLRISAPDANGREVTEVRIFTLIKSGEMVLGESTPEATLAPQSPTPTSMVEVSITPIDVSPSVIPTGTTVYDITPAPPVSGIDNSWPYAVTGAGLLMVGAGVILLF